MKQLQRPPFLQPPLLNPFLSVVGGFDCGSECILSKNEKGLMEAPRLLFNQPTRTRVLPVLVLDQNKTGPVYSQLHDGSF